MAMKTAMMEMTDKMTMMKIDEKTYERMMKMMEKTMMMMGMTDYPKYNPSIMDMKKMEEEMMKMIDKMIEMIDEIILHDNKEMNEKMMETMSNMIDEMEKMEEMMID
jgi:hypothetical protein